MARELDSNEFYQPLVRDIDDPSLNFERIRDRSVQPGRPQAAGRPRVVPEAPAAERVCRFCLRTLDELRGQFAGDCGSSPHGRHTFEKLRRTK